MPIFESPKYTELWVSDLGLGFSGGTLETDDEDAVARLRQLGELGVREQAPAPQPQPQEPGGDPDGGDKEPGGPEEKPSLTAEPPQRGASRAAWGEYAASQGLEGVEDLTKAEIIERLGLA